jgi:hypothetical protein
MNYLGDLSNYYKPNTSYNMSLAYKDAEPNMDVFHIADDFTILRQPTKIAGITVGWNYYRLTKISADEAKFYADSQKDKNDA